MNKSEKMHDAIYRARMTEDTFQILLDVMERHFAALSLPDPASDPKITRAISFSELPSTRRILIEQCYQADDSGTLVRQYSCEQIFDKRSNSGEVKVSEVLRTGSERCLSNAWTATLPIFGRSANVGWHNVRYGQNARAIEAPCGSRKMESMEVEDPKASKPLPSLPIMELNGMTLSDAADRTLFKSSTCGSLRSGERGLFAKPAVRSRSASPKKFLDRRPGETKSSELADESATKCDYDEAKKKLRSLVPETTTNSKKSNLSCQKFVFFVLLSISVVVLAILLCNDEPTRRRGLDTLNITNVSKELRERVYGQARAIDELIDSLAKSSRGINLIVLVGGTGVGKSYALGIVAKHFSPLANVLEYFSPIRKTIHEAFDALSRGGRCNLVLLENLRKTDFQEVAKFVKFLNEHTRQLCVRIVAVFNPQETDDELRRKFDSEKSAAELTAFFRDNDIRGARTIGFEDLGENSLDACIGQAARENGVELSQRVLAEIRETLVIGNSGCKGAYAKVQLLLDS